MNLTPSTVSVGAVRWSDPLLKSELPLFVRSAQDFESNKANIVSLEKQPKKKSLGNVSTARQTVRKRR